MKLVAVALVLLLLPFACAETYFYAGSQTLAVKIDGIEYVYRDRSGTDTETKSLPFGQTIVDSQRFGFTGKEVDDSKLHYFSARYYDADLGRFTSVDPVSSEPAYQFVANDPLNTVDPDGKAGVEMTLLGLTVFPEPTTTAIGLVGLAVIGAGTYVGAHYADEYMGPIIASREQRQVAVFENKRCLSCSENQDLGPTHTGGIAFPIDPSTTLTNPGDPFTFDLEGYQSPDQGGPTTLTNPGDPFDFVLEGYQPIFEEGTIFTAVDFGEYEHIQTTETFRKKFDKSFQQGTWDKLMRKNEGVSTRADWIARLKHGAGPSAHIGFNNNNAILVQLDGDGNALFYDLIPKNEKGKTSFTNIVDASRTAHQTEIDTFLGR